MRLALLGRLRRNRDAYLDYWNVQQTILVSFVHLLNMITTNIVVDSMCKVAAPWQPLFEIQCVAQFSRSFFVSTKGLLRALSTLGNVADEILAVPLATQTCATNMQCGSPNGLGLVIYDGWTWNNNNHDSHGQYH